MPRISKKVSICPGQTKITTFFKPNPIQEDVESFEVVDLVSSNDSTDEALETAQDDSVSLDDSNSPKNVSTGDETSELSVMSTETLVHVGVPLKRKCMEKKSTSLRKENAKQSKFAAEKSPKENPVDESFDSDDSRDSFVSNKGRSVRGRVCKNEKSNTSETSQSEDDDRNSEELCENRARFRSFTKEIEKQEYEETIKHLPSILSIDRNSYPKPIEDESLRLRAYEEAFEQHLKTIEIQKGKSKTYTCCGNTLTNRQMHAHVSGDHIPSSNLRLYYLKRYSPLRPCGNILEENVSIGMKSKECTEFLYHFNTYALSGLEKSKHFVYTFLLAQNIPESVSPDLVLDFAAKNSISLEIYTGKFTKKNNADQDAVCSEYHFNRINNDGGGGSIVTQFLLKGYRCFCVVENELRRFDSEEEAKTSEMLSQLFNKLCSRYTESHETKLLFSCRQMFEHEPASKQLTEDLFHQVVHDVIKCKGQAVVFGEDAVVVPLNGLYGQQKPVKLVEKRIDARASQELKSQELRKTFTVKQEEDKVKGRKHVSEKVGDREKKTPLELDYNIENSNDMKLLWHIFELKYFQRLNRKKYCSSSVALVIVVPVAYEYRRQRPIDFVSETLRIGGKIRYTFLVDTERYLGSRFRDSNEKYLVLRRWNFNCFEEKYRFFSIASIYAYFQSALCNALFEYEHFHSQHRLSFQKARKLLSDEDIRYAYSLGNSGRTVICDDDDCTENHYVFNDEAFSVPIHIDNRVVIDIPLKNGRFNDSQ